MQNLGVKKVHFEDYKLQTLINIFSFPLVNIFWGERPIEISKGSSKDTCI